MLDVHFLSEYPKVASNCLRNISKSLSKKDWCSNKGVNQAKSMLDNKMPMSPTWVGLVGYWWGWSQMADTLGWIFFEILNLSSNLLGRLIHGPFGWGYVVETYLKGQNLISLQVSNRFTNYLIFLFKIPKDNKDFFHWCRHDFETKRITRTKQQKKAWWEIVQTIMGTKTTKIIRFCNQNEKKTCLIPNLNHEKKKKNKNMISVNKNPKKIITKKKQNKIMTRKHTQD